MESKAFLHSGFCFVLKGEVLPGLVLTSLVGKDLRTAERLLDCFFLDLMMAAQSRFGDQIQQAPEPFGFVVECDPKLRQRLADVACGLRVKANISAIRRENLRARRRRSEPEMSPIGALS